MTRKRTFTRKEFAKVFRRLLDASCNGDTEAFLQVRQLCDGDIMGREEMSNDNFSNFRLENCLKLKSGLLTKPNGLMYECAECEAALCPAYPVARRILCQEDQARGILRPERYCRRVMMGEFNHADFTRLLCETCNAKTCEWSMYDHSR